MKVRAPGVADQLPGLDKSGICHKNTACQSRGMSLMVFCRLDDNHIVLLIFVSDMIQGVSSYASLFAKDKDHEKTKSLVRFCMARRF